MSEQLEGFVELVETLQAKKKFHYGKRAVYDGTHSIPSLGLALPKKFEQLAPSKLPWGRIAVDHLLQDISFDGFKGDVLGFTKLLKRYGGYSAIRSAQKNSMIGACSFITVLPNDEGAPIFTVYTGAEATGKWDSRYGFVAGLVENEVSTSTIAQNSYTVVDYLYFEPGRVHKVDPNGTILSTTEMPTDRMLFVPFIYGQDVALKPFGESRFNAPFVSALESGLRNQKNMDIASEINLSRGKVLLAEGGIDNGDALTLGDSKTNIAEMLVIKSATGTTMKLEDLGVSDVKELRDNLATCANNAASAVSMSPTAFGYQPANGSFSEGTVSLLAKPYDKLVSDSREVYGDSIRELAIAAMSMSTGQYHSDWEDIEPVFKNDFNVDKLGAVGDGLGKLLALEETSDAITDFINENVLGLSVADEAMRVRLPNFGAAKEAAEKFKSTTSLV